MNEKKLRTTSGILSGVATACCFGLLNVVLGLLGLTAAVAAVNRYGDYLFFPAYAFFATLFVWSLFRIKKKWITYTVTAVAVALGIYFMIFGITYALLILGGAGFGGIAIKWLKKK